ncbi:VOC family protein [Brevibacterium sp. 91QC2O2]|uniref:VOC family protein n=1 Tax=Brevibacterium sp. 91QC2O2 TaxID=2968458 RepID=UPI00211C57D1|nr:VOC family protein [Brevibacterium sp. 91QC2O2]MCQ9368722.1 VOC family protein [Brevibacterium sp. 91QC2O2]
MKLDLSHAHIGIQVENLDSATQELNRLFGFTFAEPASPDIQVDVPGSSIREALSGSLTVTRQGPPFIEVSQDDPESKIFRTNPGEQISFHHLGFWVDNLQAHIDELVAAGYPIEGAGLNDFGEYRYSYHIVQGLRIELADLRVRDPFEEWGCIGKPNMKALFHPGS